MVDIEYYHDNIIVAVSGVDTKHNTLSQLSFPFQDEAITALNNYKQLRVEYVQLAIGKLEGRCLNFSQHLHNIGFINFVIRRKLILTCCCNRYGIRECDTG